MDSFKVVFTLYHEKSPFFTTIWDNMFYCFTFSNHLQRIQEPTIVSSTYHPLDCPPPSNNNALGEDARNELVNFRYVTLPETSSKSP